MHSTINVHLTTFLAMMRFLGICFAMSLPVLLLPEQMLCQSPQRSTNTFKTAYNNALSAKNLRAMKTALDSILTYNGDDADARRQRLVLSWELGEWTHLDEDYTALIMRDSSNGEAWERRGVVRWYGGKVQSACEDMRHHAEDLAAHTQYGHRGTDGSLPHRRLERYAFYRKTLGENIGYGIKSARTLVVGLLLDDGVQGCGHRGNLLNPRNRSVGIATAEHPMYPCVCVQMFEEALYPHP